MAKKAVAGQERGPLGRAAQFVRRAKPARTGGRPGKVVGVKRVPAKKASSKSEKTAAGKEQNAPALGGSRKSAGNGGKRLTARVEKSSAVQGGTIARKKAVAQPEKRLPKSGGNQRLGGSQVHAEVYARIHALLHTMHAIERHEERLCSLMDQIKRRGRLNAMMLREIEAQLEEMPSFEYQHDVEALREALGV